MTEHPIDRLRHGLDHYEYARDRDLEDDALRAVEQLVEEARRLDKWHPQTQIGLAGLHPQHAGCVEAFRAALALFYRKEQTP